MQNVTLLINSKEKNAPCAKVLHIRVTGPATTLWADPIYVLLRILDVTSLAVQAVLRVNLQAWLLRLLVNDNFVHTGWAIARLR